MDQNTAAAPAVTKAQAQQIVGAIQQRIEQYIVTLVDKRFEGQKDVTPEVKKILYRDTFNRFNSYILQSTIDELSEKDLDAFEQMVNAKKNIEELQEFFESHIEDYPKFMQRVLTDFEIEYLNG